jgi:hypothetical protein
MSSLWLCHFFHCSGQHDVTQRGFPGFLRKQEPEVYIKLPLPSEILPSRATPVSPHWEYWRKWQGQVEEKGKQAAWPALGA